MSGNLLKFVDRPSSTLQVNQTMTITKPKGADMTVTEIVINKNAYYSTHDAAMLLDLPRERLNAEHKAGRLRMTRNGRRRLIKGLWLTSWLDGDNQEDSMT